MSDIIIKSAEAACSTREAPRLQLPKRLRRLMDQQKAAHWRYKQKLKKNDTTWRNDLKKRNECRSEYRTQLNIYLAQNREERKNSQLIAGANDAWDMVRKIK